MEWENKPAYGVRCHTDRDWREIFYVWTPECTGVPSAVVKIYEVYLEATCGSFWAAVRGRLRLLRTYQLPDRRNSGLGSNGFIIGAWCETRTADKKLLLWFPDTGGRKMPLEVKAVFLKTYERYAVTRMT